MAKRLDGMDRRGRSPRKRLTKMVLEAAPPKPGLYPDGSPMPLNPDGSLKPTRREVRDDTSPMVFRVTSAGNRSLTVRARINGQLMRLTYPGPAMIESLSDAREWAVKVVNAVKRGEDPRKDQAASIEKAKHAAERAERLKIENVVVNYVERRLHKEKKNRTADESERVLTIYVLSQWRGRPVEEITREDVAALLDRVSDRAITFEGKAYGGPVMVDRVLAQLRALFNWHATRDAKFISPIVRGMARTSPADNARARALSDDEIKALWTATGELGVFGSLTRLLLLTGQRRDEVSHMRRAEIDADGVWTIPAERYKTGKANIVPLSVKAREIIEAQDVINGCDLVFTTNGKTPFSGYSKFKARLDKTMAVELGDDVPHWILHDLRRTARTLMSRAGIASHTAERVLGHVIPGVEGIYDQHDYIAEKRAALEALAALVDRIVNLPAGNVVALQR